MGDTNLNSLDASILRLAEEFCAEHYTAHIRSDVLIIYQAICIGTNLGLQTAMSAYNDKRTSVLDSEKIPWPEVK